MVEERRANSSPIAQLMVRRMRRSGHKAGSGSPACWRRLRHSGGRRCAVRRQAQQRAGDRRRRRHRLRPDSPLLQRRRRNTDGSCRQQDDVGSCSAAGRYAAVLPLGDIQYDEDGTLRRLPGSSYDPTWGRFQAITRPVLGNHEYDDTPARPATSTTSTGSASPTGRPAPRGAGLVQLRPRRLAPDRAQLQLRHRSALRPAARARSRWLRARPRRHRDRCTLAYWHHPRFSSGAARAHDPASTPSGALSTGAAPTSC